MTKGAKVEIQILQRESVATEVAAGTEKVIVVPDTQRDRYANFQFIGWWDQARLRAATVMVIGVGALGNEVLKNLALMGIGRLLIIDFDTVETGNLGRSVLFRSSDSGRPKAVVAAAAVKALNPDVEAVAIQADVITGVGLGLFRRADVIIGCLDNREARLAVNSAAYRLNKPWIDGAIQELLGVVRVFWPRRGACYECTLTAADWNAIHLRYSCTLLARERLLEGKTPTTPTIASIIGAAQAQEALKLLHGLEVQAGCGLIFNGLTNHTYTVTYPQRADCLMHEQLPIDFIELPEASVTKTTIRDLFAIAQELLGQQIQLELDYELVVECSCPTCQRQTEILLPLKQLTAQQVTCSSCGRPCNIRSTHLLNGHEHFLDRSLQEIGVPPLHVITFRHRQQHKYFELSGDINMYFCTKFTEEGCVTQTH